MIVCANRNEHGLGRENYVCEEDGDVAMSVGDEYVIGITAFRIIARDEETGWCTLDPDGRVLDPEALREVFARCPHHKPRRAVLSAE